MQANDDLLISGISSAELAEMIQALSVIQRRLGTGLEDQDDLKLAKRIAHMVRERMQLDRLRNTDTIEPIHPRYGT